MRHIDVERRGDVFCVRLRQPRLEEAAIYELSAELRDLVTNDGCRTMALSLGPESPECLYSIFLAGLITLQRVLREHGGELMLCHAQPDVRDIFKACGLDPLFHFLPDFEAAVAHWTK
ncbi:MAG TPA: STAS domain-containing protein [Gemmataceae bacterium]|jgi:anti-anti-sigma factor